MGGCPQLPLFMGGCPQLLGGCPQLLQPQYVSDAAICYKCRHIRIAIVTAPIKKSTIEPHHK
jgi:hypothetical protein